MNGQDACFSLEKILRYPGRTRASRGICRCALLAHDLVCLTVSLIKVVFANIQQELYIESLTNFHKRPEADLVFGELKRMNEAETKLIASALYEIRLLLSFNLGSENEAPTEVRLAAHLAYALHNEALALAAGKSFDVGTALQKVRAIDGIVGTNDGRRLATLWSTGSKGHA